VRSASAEPRASVRALLARRIPERLAGALCAEAAVAESTPIAQLPRDARARLVARTLSRPMPVTGTLGYEKAEVTAGGVRLSEVDPRTLESRMAPACTCAARFSMSRAGSAGSNFQFSWSSGTVAGRAAAKS
jgi:predicted flavoprotein YhiN